MGAIQALRSHPGAVGVGPWTRSSGDGHLSNAKPIEPARLFVRPAHQAEAQIVRGNADRAAAALGVADKEAGGGAVLAFEHADRAGRLFGDDGAGSIDM